MWFWFSNHDLDFDFKSHLFRWFDFKIINILWWFCPSLQIMLLYYFTARMRSCRELCSVGYALWLCESSVCIAMERLHRELYYTIIKHSLLAILKNSLMNLVFMIFSQSRYVWSSFHVENCKCFWKTWV